MIRPGENYRVLDSEVAPGITYYSRLEALDRTGSREFFGPVSARFEPRGNKPILNRAFPNPFRSATTTIPFTLASPGKVSIRVLDLAGREVRILLNGIREAGDQSISWNGRNQRGELVQAGMYLYQLQTQGFKATRKLIRLR